VISITPEDDQGDKIDLHWRFRGTQIDQLPADRIIRTVIVKKNKGQSAITDKISLSGKKGLGVVMAIGGEERVVTDSVLGRSG